MKSNLSYSPETLNSCQNWRFLSCVTLKLDGWPWKTIGHLIHTALSFVQHFKANGIFKLELQSRKRSIRVKIGGFFVQCDLENLRMTLKNNRAPLLCCFNLWAELQSGNAQFMSKSRNFFSLVTLKFHWWPWQTIGHLLLATSSCVHHCIAICEFKQ